MQVNPSTKADNSAADRIQVSRPTVLHRDSQHQAQSGTAVSSRSSASPVQLESNVTFRRDANGQVYYVVTDAQSGKELREVPSQEIRRVGEGIAKYLEREHGKRSHIEVKA